MLERICCVVCMKVLEETDFEECYLEEFKSETNSEERVCASFKCLNIDPCYVSEVFQELQNSEFFDNLGIRIPRIYCLKCHARNGTIFQVLQQIADLESKLNTLKGSVLEDFKRTLVFSQDHGREVRQDGVQVKLDNIRTKVAKDLQLVPRRSAAPAVFDDDDEWEPCAVPSVEYSDSEEVDQGIVRANLEKEDELRRAYDITDCHVVLQRLSPELLRLMLMKKTNAEETAIEKEGQAIQKKERKFKCLFDDCHIKTTFMTILGRNTHLMKLHGLTEDEVLELDEQIAREKHPLAFGAGHDPEGKIGQNNKGKRPRILRCTFDDCPSEEIFETSLLLRQHLEGVHCIQVSDSEEYDSDASSATKNKDDGSSVVLLKCVFDDCMCTDNFLTNSDLLKHIKDAHDVELSESDLPQPQTGDDPTKSVNLRLKCLYVDCPFRKRFATRRIRRAHVKKYHERNPEASERLVKVNVIRETGKRILCPVPNCKVRKYFNTQGGLDEHMKWVHEGTPVRFKCFHCDKYCVSRHERDVHIKKDHVGVCNDICHVCGDRFKNTKDLNRHFVKHTDARPWKCKFCPSTFRTAAGVDYHQRSQHTKEFRYHCEHCGKGFYGLEKFTSHVKCVHEDARPCICEVCGRGFAIKRYLTIHMRVHKREQGIPVPRYIRKSRRKTVDNSVPKQRKPRRRRVHVDLDPLIVHPPNQLIEPPEAGSSALVNSCSNSAPVDLTQEYGSYNFAPDQDHSRSMNTTPSTMDSVHGDIQYPSNTAHHSQLASNQFLLTGFQNPGQASQNQLIPNQYLQFMSNYGNYSAENQRRN